MAKVDIPKIRSICNSLNKADPLWRQISNQTYQEPALTLTHEVEDLRTLIADSVPASGTTVKMFEPMFSACEIALVQLTDLVFVCANRTDTSKQLLWPGRDTRDGAFSGTFILQILLTNLANTLLAIRQLVLLGLDGQARVLLRWFVELADMTTAALFDYDCFSHYAHSGEGFKEDYEKWRSHLAPSKIRRVLERFDEFAVPPNKDLNHTQSYDRRDFIEDSRNIRRSTYEWLSLYSHANSLAQTISTVKDISDDGLLVPKLGGRAGGYADFRSKPTIFKAALYSWMTCSQIFWLLIRKHDWITLAEEESESFGRLYCRWQILKHYGATHYVKMKEVALEEDEQNEPEQ